MSVSSEINNTMQEYCKGFDAIAVGALGQKKVQDILINVTQPLTNSLQSDFNALKNKGFGQYGKPFRTVNLKFVTQPSKKYPNTVQTGPVGKGWQTAFWLEYGTTFRRNTGKKSNKYKGRETGIMPATFFMRKAFDRNEENITIKGVEMFTNAILETATKEGMTNG